MNICRNVFEQYLPLAANAKENEFKIYYNDTGLLMARYGFQTKLAVLNGSLLRNAKGGIYENLVSELLIKNGYSLHYFKTENSTIELEFLLSVTVEFYPLK